MKAYISLLSSVLVSGSVYAACTPAPDCASLGYTATSCPNGGVRCPWDTNLWHCDKDNCGEAYKYTCTGTGYTGGTGTACSNKYTSCNCASGYMWKSGSCQKTMSTYAYCCCGNECGNYSHCKKHDDYEDCSSKQSTCYSQGGTPRFLRCDGNYDGDYYDARFECTF